MNPVKTAPADHDAAPITESIEVSDEKPTLNIAEVRDALLGTFAKERLEARELCKNPDLHYIPGMTMEEHRARVLKQLGILVKNNAIQRAFPSYVGGGDNHGGNIAAFQELVFADASLQIKSGVQWGLFGAAIQHLGTEKHHKKYLPDVLSLKLPGAFAMTETGHGSDVASIATTATYDEISEEFVINTPFRGAWKDYLGNAALHGKACVLFAQLITKGENHGVHAFFVPIRDAKGKFLPGIGGDDDGFKGGLNGIDNGRLHFSGVRVPRENLLNRYGDVAVDGSYSSPIESKGRRFFTMISTLVQGRVSLDGASANAIKLALAIAIRYSSERRQFADVSGEERVLLDYQTHQRRLLPRLAEAFAISFAGEKLLVVFDEVFSGKNNSEENSQDLETLAAAFKSMSTWAALDTLQAAREACGGQGFLAENRLVGLRQDLDVYVTFEGDNTVLLQLVGKRLLQDYAAQFKGADTVSLAKHVATDLGGKAFSRSGLRTLLQDVTDLGSTARAVGHLRDTETQRSILTNRVEMMVAEIASALKDASKGGKPAQAAAFDEHQFSLIEAAKAHAELLQWEAFTEALDQFDAGTKTIMTWLRDLFGLSLIEKHAAWYLANGALSGSRVQAVTAYIDRLLVRIRPYALDLVETFDLGPELIRAPIGLGAEAERQDEARAYYAAHGRI
jgi:acyl-CoA oxidase